MMSATKPNGTGWKVAGGIFALLQFAIAYGVNEINGSIKDLERNQITIMTTQAANTQRIDQGEEIDRRTLEELNALQKTVSAHLRNQP